MKKHQLKNLLAITKALADENRVRALMALSGGELCACKLIELLQLAPSTVSKHMSILAAAGLVQTRKSGKWVYYNLSDNNEYPLAGQFADLATASLKGDSQIARDAKLLKNLRKMSREEICAKQACKR